MAYLGFGVQEGGLLKILYLGIRNSIEELESAAFTKVNNSGNAQLAANTTTHNVNKLGLLAGSVVASKGNGVIGAGAADNDAVLGLMVNDASGNAYESSSAAASGKGVYVCGMGVYEVGVYETHDFAGANPLAYAYGDKLYCSQNGLLTNAAGLQGGAISGVDAVVIGIVTKAATPSDPTLRFNLRV